MTQHYQAFIFDMDGVLLDSEPFWRRSQIELLREMGHTITIDDCIANTMGKRIDDIAKCWIKRFKLALTVEELAQSILNRTITLISKEAIATEGLHHLVGYLKTTPLKIGLATSSSQAVIDAVVNTLGLNEVFDVTLSADEVVNGKPAPDVYLEVCRRMQVDPTLCFALEDSLTGVKAAVASGAITIAKPEFEGADFDIARYQVSHLSEVIDIVDQLI